jgi:hydroxymethyl cephem carbamoyltransferase
MLIVALKPGHDGSVAVLRDEQLLLVLEAEKNSFPRHESLTPSTLLSLAEHMNEIPDVIALGGWHKRGALGCSAVGSGYLGVDIPLQRSMRFFGKKVSFFSSTHERSHIMMAIGMAPKQDHEHKAVLVWEGGIGAFYLLDNQATVIGKISVIAEPGARYAFLYALADPTFPDSGSFPNLTDSGKLMALASFAQPQDADSHIAETIDKILKLDTLYPAPKHQFRKSVVYNAGVEADATKIAAALLTQRLFDVFAHVAEMRFPRNTPLHISGGCGLNCQWNQLWRQSGYFSSVFVPPCTNDSGSAIGTAIDALATLKGNPYISWDVYSGLEFENDIEPPSSRWYSYRVDHIGISAALAAGQVVAWVQGRWEIGPRALGNRSLLAEPFNLVTRDRLNHIKGRESFRPIAPCCRAEDAGRFFADSFEDPYMLYSRNVRASELKAVTHVDGSARLQTVTRDSNLALYELLTIFAKHSGIGVLCNTSLNFKGLGFINRMSDLVAFCENKGIENMVVGDTWFRHCSVQL